MDSPPATDSTKAIACIGTNACSPRRPPPSLSATPSVDGEAVMVSPSGMHRPALRSFACSRFLEASRSRNHQSMTHVRQPCCRRRQIIGRRAAPDAIAVRTADESHRSLDSLVIERWRNVAVYVPILDLSVLDLCTQQLVPADASAAAVSSCLRWYPVEVPPSCNP